LISLNEVYRLLPPALNKKVLTKKQQSTKDIIAQVLEQHKANVKYAKRIAHLFDAGSAYGTCLNIWNFLKYNVPYKVEPSDRQSTKTLSRILYDAKNGAGNDCKHYSGFTGAILEALGYKFKYRFTGYSNYIPTPTHVYCVCTENNNEIIIDAVLSGFDVEKPFKFKIDKSMSLYKLSGIDTDEAQVGNIFKKAFNKAKGAVKSAGQAIKNVANTVKQGALTVGLAVPRNAFLVLLRFNVHGWATGLSKMSFDRLKFWANFGGNRTELMNAIKAGASKKRILGINDNDVITGIGEPVTVAAALASATPIIIKVTQVLKDAEKISNQVEGITSSVDKTTDAINKGSQAFKNLTGGRTPADIIFKKEQGQQGDKNSLSTADFKQPTDKEANDVAAALVNRGKSTGLNKMYLIGGAATIAAIVLLSKRKK
jgi:hypothetical protein